ncbi:FkbM family methyltransferase [Varunaivibrio sulfuroxidans]|uniref:FkbM family methyltransferase n=1 Tax=Varunaivibrio sulfuroxidans TaxID=1773489 RepID=A0A4R3J4G4_9PROT|nr:FkbM family methyltransferase [Varunaivibrio sulfuroxidans]TCS60112.1 FkbM family methyltransferase [Varunaivibrio sulfuroxidans]WES30914.1 FkbM family methyltransferase [Varunaivibrio sulfuroxidans]
MNMPTDPTQAPPWEPTSTLEEKLKNFLIPPTLYYRHRAQRELRKGESELALIPHLANRDQVSIDVGANKGVFTYWLERYSVHVYAYEPNPKIFKILKAATRLSTNVTVSPIALSDRSENTVLRVPRGAKGYSNQGASLNFEKVGDSYGEACVATRRLDDENIENIGFIKIDVEGHEFAVLDGAIRTIERERPVMLIEIEEAHNKIPIHDAVARVAALDYHALFLWHGILTDFTRFDPKIHHDRATNPNDYVFNFIFLPRDTPRHGAYENSRA